MQNMFVKISEGNNAGSVVRDQGVWKRTPNRR